MTERRYVLTKVASGDYLLPSNDGQTVFRLARDEDEGWGVWRWNGETGPGVWIDPIEWDNWQCEAAHLPTRRDAIEAALA